MSNPSTIATSVLAPVKSGRLALLRELLSIDADNIDDAVFEQLRLTLRREIQQAHVDKGIMIADVRVFRCPKTGG